MSEKKQDEFSMKIIGQLQDLFNEDCENYIDPQELNDHATDFIHALANIAPTHVYNFITSSNKTMLDFNHLANRLVMQNINIIENQD